jgi:dihydroorotase
MTTPTTLIKNALCVFPDGIRQDTILLKDGKIHIAPPSTSAADRVIDATGLHLIPGVIDDQVHFRDPGLTHKEDLHTGSKACAKGGVTTFFDMPNTEPTTTTCDRLEKKLDLAAGKSMVNFGFFIGATLDNIYELQDAERTPGIKIFIGSSTGNLLVDDQEALEQIFAETKLPICAHCEDEETVQKNKTKRNGGREVEDHSSIRDHQAAIVATRRSIDLATRHKHAFHVLHVSTADEIPLIKAAKGLVTAEVCPHHLFFNVDDYRRLGSLVQMNPSIKDASDNQALWNALIDGTIQVIATDHAPHTLEEKLRPYPLSPSGMPSVENSLALMLDAVNHGKITLERVVEAMCAGPAKVWNIIGKGSLKEGYDADVVLVDLNKSQKILNAEQVTKCNWSPWHGDTLKGWAVKTFVNGHLVFEDGKFDETVRGKEVQFNPERPGYWKN